MKMLKDLLLKHKIDGKNLKDFGNSCRDSLIESGMVYSEVYGWEKPEIVESFGLDVNAKGVPSIQDFEMDFKETVVSQKDEYGNNTGNKEVKRVWYQTNKKFWRPTDNYLAYMQFKKDRWAKYDKENYAIKANNPPVADEYYN